MPLPTIFDPVSLRALLAQETQLMDIAETLISQGECDEGFTAELIEQKAILANLNEASYAHESNHPEDQMIHAALMQVKAWHLARIDGLVNIPLQ